MKRTCKRCGIKQDMQVMHFNKEDGWDVVRIWGKDLKKDPEKFGDMVERMVRP